MKKAQKKLTITITLVMALTLISACGNNSQTEKTEINETEEHHNDEYVNLSKEEMEEFGIETQTAGPGKLAIQTVLPGEVVIPPDNLAHIYSRFPGIVKEVRKHIGDKVKKGDTLAILESNESLSAYPIVSMIPGEVIEKHFTRGELVEDKSHGFVIADLSKIWIILQAYQKDLPYLKKGQRVLIKADDGVSKGSVVSKISYISPVVDEKSRTAKIRVEVKNHPRWLKPGLFVTGHVTVDNEQARILIPKTAVEMINGKKVVFVKTGEGFIPREINTGKINEQFVEVLTGLKEGDLYVSKNGFILKSEMEKGEFGDDDHGH